MTTEQSHSARTAQPTKPERRASHHFIREQQGYTAVLITLTAMGMMINILLPGATQLKVLGDRDAVAPVVTASPLQWIGWAAAVLVSVGWPMVRHRHGTRTASPWPGLMLGAGVYGVVVVIFLSSAHLGPYYGRDSAFKRLMRYPDSSQAEAAYRSLNDRLLSELAQSDHLLSKDRTEPDFDPMSCDEPIDDDGREGDFSDYLPLATFSDAEFARAVKTVVATARREGHPLRLHNRFDATNLNFEIIGGAPADYVSLTLAPGSSGDRAAIYLEIDVDCHLTRAAKRRGHPS